MDDRKGKVEFYKDKKDEYRWRLKAPNGEIIADSGEGYTTFQNCEHGYECVKNYAQDAVIVKDF